MQMKFCPLLLLVGLTFSTTVNAQTEADSSMFELENMSAFEEASALQKSLNTEFGAGALEGMSSREVPNIVSFITAEEIRNTGARDMIDVLRLVPGFDFGTDSETAVGPIMRGNWAMEGKILLMIDGIEMNELAYQNLFFGHHLPVDLIERIEIIRGSGSANYGGTAEYGVINIVTKGKKGPEGLNLYATYSHLGSTYGRRQAGLSFKKNFGKVTLDLTSSFANNRKSDDDYITFTQDTINYATGETGKVTPSYANLGISTKNLEVRALMDNYVWNTHQYEIHNQQFAAYAKYNLRVSNKLLLTPLISYTNQLPVHYESQISTDERDWLFYKVRASRILGNLTGHYNFTRRLSLSSGAEWQYAHAKDLLYEKGGKSNFGDHADSHFHNYSMFAQALWKNYFVNLTAGVRYEYQEGIGDAIAPRLAATKHWNRFHIKLLYSHAFRMPGIENMNLALGELHPEVSKVMEAELGYQLTKDMIMTVNTFRMHVHDIIVYGIDPATQLPSYLNEEETGSSGIEAAFKIQKSIWRGDLTYSFYHSSHHATVATYRVPGVESTFIGAPNHKLTFNGTVYVNKNLNLNTSAAWHSERYGYTKFTDANQIEQELKRFVPYTLLNLYIRYSNVLPGLHIGTGVYNLLDEKHGYIQPYQGNNAPAPAPGREWVIKAQYELPFTKK